MRRLHRPPCPNPEALKTNYKHAENKTSLEAASHGKCMYCESQVSHVYFGDVEHIRPKAANKYPHLEFDWSNLGYCCARCNNAKSNQFEEECPLIDPYTENPNDHLLAFGSLIRHKTGSERGALTIKTVDLNRSELLERRNHRIESIQNAIDACYRTSSATIRQVLLHALFQEAEANREFSIFAAALIAANKSNDQ